MTRSLPRVLIRTQTMLCQTCSAFNDDEREFCYRCQNKLMVLSGVTSFEEDEIEDYEEEEDLSLDEHLLERKVLFLFVVLDLVFLEGGDAGEDHELVLAAIAELAFVFVKGAAGLAEHV